MFISGYPTKLEIYNFHNIVDLHVHEIVDLHVHQIVYLYFLSCFREALQINFDLVNYYHNQLRGIQNGIAIHDSCEQFPVQYEKKYVNY